jgi:cyclopropane-fatty-acyl-phospholipid synthase
MAVRLDIAAGPTRRLDEAADDQTAVRSVPNDFYALWLDRRMIYSCACFRSPGDDLDIAQKRRLDALCSALRLCPGQRLLDVGCDWGGLVMHAAERFGVDATGITLSRSQADLANQRLAANPHIAADGLAGRCRVEVNDYRRVKAPPQGYDALVSVGMAEHIGDFAWAMRLLRPGGALLMHSMAGRPRCGADVSDSYAFPGGEPSPLNFTLRAAEGAGFEVQALESLREDFKLTLRHWMRRLEAQRDQALRLVGEPAYRAWWLFMSDLAHAFSVGRVNAYQVLLVKPERTNGRGATPVSPLAGQNQ